MTRWLAGCVVLCLLTRPAASEEPWEFSLSPYIWMASVNGSLEAQGRSADFNASFGDIINDLDFTAMGAFEVRKGRWGFIGDFIYLDVTSYNAPPRGILFDKAVIDISSVVGTGALAYRVFEDEAFSLDGLVGFRVWSLDETTTLKSGREHVKDRSFSADDTWVDPILGARVRYTFGEHWFVTGEGDVGGFGVGSELDWQLLGTGGYRFDEAWSLQVGYRHLSVKRDFGEVTMKLDLSGPILGVTYRF